jgi:nucleotidyltransferase substrate binding protein (TIGR01987 family)
MIQDIRWIQRYANFQKALEQLQRFVGKEDLNEMEEQGLIQAFEYTFELAWKTLQDLLEEEYGYTETRGPRPVIMQAFSDGVITRGEQWMEMLKDRNRTVHTYDEAIAKEIIASVKNEYIQLFKALNNKFQQIQNKSEQH